jgi:acyl dehydratase
VLARLVKPTSADEAAEYAAGLFDVNPLFHDKSPWGPPLMHPGWLLSNANSIFTQSFAFGPWIHTRSEIRYFGPALAGRTFTLHARLSEAYERREHHYAVLDQFCLDDHDLPVMQVRHTAIFKVHPKA